MRWRAVLGNLGTILRMFSVAFLLPLVPALVYERGVPGHVIAGTSLPQTVPVFAGLFAGTLAMGLALERIVGEEEFRENEGFVMVGVGYLVLAGLGALPYMLTGTIPGVVDAYFESMSGFTTVGATVMSYPLEAHPPSVLFWRSLTQWIGGMGIIVLGVALLPKLVESGANIMRAEFSGGHVRLRPKMMQTARSFWTIYLAITATGAGALALAMWATGAVESPGLAVFEAVNHAFTSIATGGFSTRTASIAAFDSPLVEAILSVMMIAGATSFVLHYRALYAEGGDAYRDEEFAFLVTLLASVAAGVAVILFFFGSPHAWSSMGGQPDALAALRHAFFNVTSVLTTTGYASADFDAWPDAARILLILLMITGGMAGSTSGGIKAMRILTMMKMLRRETVKLTRPRAVMTVRMHGSSLSEGVLDNIAAFFFAFVTVLLVSTILLTFTGLDMVAAFTSSAATLTTLGPAMGGVVGGPDFTYAAVHPIAKLVLTFNMWFGRLEIFAALLILLPSTYRR